MSFVIAVSADSDLIGGQNRIPILLKDGHRRRDTDLLGRAYSIGMPAGFPHHVRELRPADGSRKTPGRVAVVSLPIRIRAMGEKPGHGLGRDRGIPQPHTRVKKRAAVRFAGDIHVDATLEPELRQLLGHLSQLRVAQIRRHRAEPVLWRVRCRRWRPIEEPVPDRRENPSNPRSKRGVLAVAFGQGLIQRDSGGHVPAPNTSKSARVPIP